MAPFARALVYATLFISLLLVLLPAQVLRWAGVASPAATGPLRAVGMLLAVAGAALAVACVAAFAFVGRGTPAPFDPPRRLVVAGPYRVIRNPMYVGAGLALLGAALYFRSLALLAYLAALGLAAHLFVVLYEEPTLRRLFGTEYDAYCARTGRWWPGR